MDKETIVSGFISEMRRGTIILCALAKLKEPMYGYNLIETLANFHVPIEANTLYPLLRRLESQGLLESSWNTETTKPRKYYTITPLGTEILKELTQHWQNSTHHIAQVLEVTL